MSKFSNPFIALRHRNYRYYAVGMLISMIGTWMQNIAQPWLAFSLTHSPFLLSLVGALQFTPVLLFSLPAGVIIDRYPRKTIIMITQAASVAITLVLAVLAWSGKIQYWQILVLATAQGFVNTLDMPTRQAFVVDMVGRDYLMNAIALNSTIFNLSRVIGPAIAGVLIAAVGVPACFLINAISYAAVLVSLIFIHPLNLTKAKAHLAEAPLQSTDAPSPMAEANGPTHIKIETPDHRASADILGGIRYILKDPILVETMVLIAIIGTFVPNYSVSVPVFTTEVLHLGESGFGFLMSFLGIGSFAGALYIAAISQAGPSRRIMKILPLIICLFMILTGFTSTFIWSALLLALTGFFFVAFTSNANSTLQLTASDNYRGRVMSVYSLIFGGSTPIGNLYTGLVIEKFKARMGFIACGVIMVILLGVYYGIQRRHRLRNTRH